MVTDNRIIVPVEFDFSKPVNVVVEVSGDERTASNIAQHILMSMIKLILTDNAGYAEAKTYSQAAGISKAIVMGGESLISDGVVSGILN